MTTDVDELDFDKLVSDIGSLKQQSAVSVRTLLAGTLFVLAAVVFSLFGHGDTYTPRNDVLNMVLQSENLELRNSMLALAGNQTDAERDLRAALAESTAANGTLRTKLLNYESRASSNVAFLTAVNARIDLTAAENRQLRELVTASASERGKELETLRSTRDEQEKEIEALRAHVAQLERVLAERGSGSTAAAVGSGSADVQFHK